MIIRRHVATFTASHPVDSLTALHRKNAKDFGKDVKDLAILKFNLLASILPCSGGVGVLYVLEFISICLQYDSLTYLLAESLFNNQSFTDADFSDLFDWNTKQLFILVVAHYRTRNNVSYLLSSSRNYWDHVKRVALRLM